MGAKLPEVFELPTVTITLHDILVSTITRILVAHKSVEKSQSEREGSVDEMLQKMVCCESRGRIIFKMRWEGWGHSRSRLDPERANFIVAPAHGLEGGIIVTQLALTAQEVLTLVDGHTTLSVVLQGRERTIGAFELLFQSKHRRVEEEEEGLSRTAQAIGLKEVILSMW